MNPIINKLIDIKDDVDAIDHHQTDRIVSELARVIEQLKKSEKISSSTAKGKKSSSKPTTIQRANSAPTTDFSGQVSFS